MSAPPRSRAVWRRHLIDLRRQMDGATRARADARLIDALATFLPQRFGPLERLAVGAYWPMAGEPDISPLYPRFAALALPKVTARDAPLTFLRYRAGDALVTQGMGVQVPAEEELLQPSLLLVPCIGFHIGAGGRIDRLGYGGGFYDRTLAAARLPAVGVGYASGRIAQFSVEPHDQALDAMVTDEGPQN